MTHAYDVESLITRPAPLPINPPERLLMGPGPSNPDPRVLAAMGKNPIGHLDPYFVQLMDEVMLSLRSVYRTKNHHTLPISGTGSAGLETIVLNLLEPGDRAVVCVGGHFGERLAELSRRTGADVRTVDVPPGAIVDPRDVEKALAEKKTKLLAFVHVETSTGACQPVAALAEAAHKHGALVAMDCVTSLGGVKIEIDTLGVDAAGSCTQKCLGAPAGLGPITVGPRAMAAVRARKTKPSTWYMDLTLLFQYWGEDGAKKRAFHHTAPTASLYGIHEALRLILEESLERRWVRHQKAHEVLLAGLGKLGLELFTPASHRVPTITVVKVPDGVEEAKVRSRLLSLGVEMGGGLGALAGKVWRIGVMGYNADTARVQRFLDKFAEALRAEGVRS